MKIVFYNHTGTVSGAERVLLMILRGLDRQRYETVVICPEGSRLMDMTRAAGARTLPLKTLEARFTWRPDLFVRYLRSFAAVIKDARRLIRREAPDAVHANSIRAGLVMTAATVGMRVPIIWHSHDILPRHPLSVGVRLCAWTIGRNWILAVSQAVADRFHGILSPVFSNRLPVTVIHNAVDLQRFQPDAKARESIRREFQISDRQPLIASVGQLTPRKGQRELIEAFAKIVAEIPDSMLLIVGEPLFNRDEEYAAQLCSLAHRLGISNRVCFTGSRDDIPALLQGADVLVVNSHQEPFALTVLEGLASGAAVLATAVGGTPEMVSHLQNGYLVNSRSASELSAALLALLRSSDLRHELGGNARRNAIEKFSIERFINQIEDLYRQVIRSGKTPHRENVQPLEAKLTAD